RRLQPHAHGELLMRFHWMILAALATSGCSALFNVDDYEVGGGQNERDASVVDAGEPPDSGPFDAGPLDAGDPDGGPADAGPSCPPTHRCVPQPGPPWMGPFAITDGHTSCGGAFPTRVMDLFDDLQVPTSQCTCTCGA